jgi:stage II sporulation protein D
MRRFLLLTVAFSLLAPSAAQGATRFVVRGAGFGHGVGLSQFGAYGYAQHGRSYRDILDHYYSGVQLGRASNAPVRVLLETGSSIAFRGASRVSNVKLRPRTIYRVRPSGNGLAFTARHRVVARSPGPVRVSRPGHPIRLLGHGINGVESGLYRGSIEFRGGRGVMAVNVLALNDYVQGVVPGEMPSSWPSQALEAQAVTARSYALATIKPGAAFDLYPDTRSQVYRGVIGEAGSTNAAVQATSGEVVTYGGQVAITYYFSASGGKTENVENSFLDSTPRPWLKGVDDPYDGISPRHRWSFTFTARQLQARLRGYVAGRFRKILVVRRGVSPRIVRARVYGTRGTRLINGPAIRSRLGLYDTWAYFTKVSASQAQAGSALAALFGLRLPRPLAITGVFDPAPRRGRLVVERRLGHRWKRARRVRTHRHGRYRTRLHRPGLYRVRAGRVTGPAVRVR